MDAEGGKMTESRGELGYQRHGLYYPYFHFRHDRWLKVAALYWPKMVRIVPNSYQTRDSETVRALAGNFIISIPPGRSVDSIAPRFTDLIANYNYELRERYSATSPPSGTCLVRKGLGQNGHYRPPPPAGRRNIQSQSGIIPTVDG